MNKMIPVHNNTAMPMWVGGVMIPPDETKSMPAHQVPAHLRPGQPAAPEPETADPLQVILAHKAPEIEAMLSAMSDDELQALKQAEETGKARKGLLAAIAEDELRRANEKTGDAGTETDKDSDSTPAAE